MGLIDPVAGSIAGNMAKEVVRDLSMQERKREETPLKDSVSCSIITVINNEFTRLLKVWAANQAQQTIINMARQRRSEGIHDEGK